MSRPLLSWVHSPVGVQLVEPVQVVGCQTKQQVRRLALLATESRCHYYCGRSADGVPVPDHDVTMGRKLVRGRAPARAMTIAKVELKILSNRESPTRKTNRDRRRPSPL